MQSGSISKLVCLIAIFTPNFIFNLRVKQKTPNFIFNLRVKQKLKPTLLVTRQFRQSSEMKMCYETQLACFHQAQMQNYEYDYHFELFWEFPSGDETLLYCYIYGLNSELEGKLWKHLCQQRPCHYTRKRCFPSNENKLKKFYSSSLIRNQVLEVFMKWR